jgi:siroheme decarboxylase
LLNVVQTHVPLVQRPFAALAEQLGATEEQVLGRVSALKGETGGNGVIRQMSAIFDSQALGYSSTLVAAQIDEERLDAAAAVISGHPGVSHNYRRNHAFNLWYTLAVPPDSALGLERTVRLLHGRSGSRVTRMLQTLRRFKIGVRFDVGGDEEFEIRNANSGIRNSQPTSSFAATERPFEQHKPLSAKDKEMIRILQQDLPITPEPFAVWAEQAGVPVEALLAAANELLARRLMRRFAAVLRHREAGFAANAMGVWAVSPERTEAFGAAAAAFPAVSHCYERQSFPDWPFTVFTMVHGATREACEAVLAAISEATGVKEYAALYSTKEYKKQRVRYFTEEAGRWEAGQMANEK